MGSKITIIEGNSNDKDNIRIYMVKGEQGYSAYDLYVQNGGTLTEEEWLDSFLNADNFYSKTETNTLLGNKVNYTDIIDNLTSSATDKVLSAKQGKVLNDNKAEASNVYTKTQTYSKTETDNKYINNTYDNEANLTFAQKGTGRIVRRGNVVTIIASISLDASETHTLANYDNLPSWAIPSTEINPTDEYNSIRSSVGTDMNLKSTGYILVRGGIANQIALVCNNTDSGSSSTLTLILTYIVD